MEFLRHFLIMIASQASMLILLMTLIIYWLIRHDARRNAIWDSTQQVYREWWGDEMRELRQYFYRDFLHLNRHKLLGKCIKEIEQSIPEDQGRIRKLCYFFERVGWLGAAGLIDVDYILGPMQHCVRFVWIAMEPFVIEERHPHNKEHVDSVHHSVYLSGFEWLYKRSNRKHQADLIRSKFSHPRLRSRKEIVALHQWIDEDEREFRRRLDKQN